MDVHSRCLASDGPFFLFCLPVHQHNSLSFLPLMCWQGTWMSLMMLELLGNKIATSGANVNRAGPVLV